MNRFSIRDIENLTGIKAHTLRIWEQRHGILVPKRTDTNIRYYDDNDLKKALRVALLNQNGYKISHIQRMDDEQIGNILNSTSDQQFQFDHLVNNLLECMLDMDTFRFETLLDKYVSEYGIEETIEKLLFSFLEKIGFMWMTDRIFPAHEHLVSNVITRKLLLAIEKLPPTDNRKRHNTVLLFLPEGELHEIGLLYMHYILLKNRRNVIYLGANSPVSQVELVCQTLAPCYLYTHITAASNDFDIQNYFRRLSNIATVDKVFASGTIIQKNKITEELNKVNFFTTLEDTKEHLSKLM